jgi:hypothetical protein
MGGGIGAAFGAAAAVEIIAVNERTLNPASSVLVAFVWVAAAIGAGVLAGWIGGRFFRILRTDPGNGAVFFASICVGHLFLPLGVGPAVALALWSLRVLRRRWLPSRSRIDVAMPALAAASIASLLLSLHPLRPPALDASEPLSLAVPVPGSVPVTVSVHTIPGYPEVPALHIPLRPLVSRELGLRATLWSGRVPGRTRAGLDRPRRVPFGGGFSWIPPRPGAEALAHLFPLVEHLEEIPFRIAGSLPAVARAAGIPVLYGPPRDGDPEFFLRIVDEVAPVDDAAARAIRATSAWIDVTLTNDKRAEIALTGIGIALDPLVGLATLMDVTPTALHLLGLAVPRSCDGRVLVEHMEGNGPGGRPPRYRSLVAADLAINDSTTPR